MTKEEVRAIVLEMVKSDTKFRNELLELLKQPYCTVRLADAVASHLPKANH